MWAWHLILFSRTRVKKGEKVGKFYTEKDQKSLIIIIIIIIVSIILFYRQMIRVWIPTTTINVTYKIFIVDK